MRRRQSKHNRRSLAHGTGQRRLGEGRVYMEQYAKAFYFSAAWKACRTAYLKKAGGLCERSQEWFREDGLQNFYIQ